jgi:seryl-tRNA synthetase
MHDLNYFRDHLDVFAEMAKKRGTPLHLEAFRVLDAQRRELITATEALKAQRNKASDEIARLKKAKQDADALIGEMKTVSDCTAECHAERIAFDDSECAARVGAGGAQRGRQQRGAAARGPPAL